MESGCSGSPVLHVDLAHVLYLTADGVGVLRVGGENGLLLAAAILTIGKKRSAALIRLKWKLCCGRVMAKYPLSDYLSDGSN